MKTQFASSSFYTAVSVIKSNTALYKAAFILQLAAVAWSIVWTVACTWAIKAEGIWVGLFFLVSYFWVSIIIVVKIILVFISYFFSRLHLLAFVVASSCQQVEEVLKVGFWALLLRQLVLMLLVSVF